MWIKRCTAEVTNKETGELYRCRGEMVDMGSIINPDDPLHPEWVFQCHRCGFQHVYRCATDYNPTISNEDAYAMLYDGIFGSIRPMK